MIIPITSSLIAGIAVGSAFTWRLQRQRRPSRGVQATLTPLSVDEAEGFLQGGLVGADLVQLDKGVPGISKYLHSGFTVYNPKDNQEEWKTLWDVWTDCAAYHIWLARGGDPDDLAAFIEWAEGMSWDRADLPSGDCEDLAAAVAAERTYHGHPSTIVLYSVRPGLSHAVVQDLQTGERLDPSVTGGMLANQRRTRR